MDFFRTARNPWGEEIYLGLNWTTFWIVVGLGALFVLSHALLARRGAKAAAPVGGAASGGIPARVVRHGRSARISHWILAASVLALLITSFVPIFGLKFPWLTIHWVAGLILAAYVLYHTVDTIARRSLGSMLGFYRGEIGQSLSTLTNFMKGGKEAEARTGKWNVENKLFHHLTALTGLLAIGTGLLMLVRIDTWFWTANPYGIFTDKEWGVVFVLHGVSAVAFVGLLIAHIYFALRPDKFFFTKSMIFGWIKREDYLAHFDPQRWRVGAPPATKPAEAEKEPVVAGSGSAERR